MSLYLATKLKITDLSLLAELLEEYGFSRSGTSFKGRVQGVTLSLLARSDELRVFYTGPYHNDPSYRKMAADFLEEIRRRYVVAFATKTARINGWRLQNITEQEELVITLEVPEV